MLGPSDGERNAILDAILTLMKATEMGLRVSTPVSSAEAYIGALETRLGNFEAKVYERFERAEACMGTLETRPAVTRRRFTSASNARGPHGNARSAPGGPRAKVYERFIADCRLSSGER
jgi:hypothetical protein